VAVPGSMGVKGGVKPSQWGGVRIGHWIAV
jgi:hypothetical protein